MEVPGARKRKRDDEVPVFVQTLFALMGDCDASIVRWSEDGSQIVIADPARFAAEVCPRYFRHRNFSSCRLLSSDTVCSMLLSSTTLRPMRAYAKGCPASSTIGAGFFFILSF